MVMDFLTEIDGFGGPTIKADDWDQALIKLEVLISQNQIPPTAKIIGTLEERTEIDHESHHHATDQN